MGEPKSLSRAQLQQYRDLQNEIRLLESTVDCPMVTDTVKGSMTCAPYIQRTVTITGYEPETQREVHHRRALARSRRTQARAIERCVQELDDGYIRAILSLRYLEGLTWGQVAMRLGGGNSPDGVRMAARRFLKDK